MIHCMMLINRQGKIRLVKWFDVAQITDKYKYMREVAVTVIGMLMLSAKEWAISCESAHKWCFLRVQSR